MPATEGSRASALRLKPAARAVCQVMAALKNCKETAGPTMTSIVKYISSSLNRPATKRQVLCALKRGVEFGIIKRKRGHYQVSSVEDELGPKPSSVEKKKSSSAQQAAAVAAGQLSKYQGKVQKRDRLPLKARHRPRATTRRIQD